MNRLLKLDLKRSLKEPAFKTLVIIVMIVAFFQVLVAFGSHYEDYYTHEIIWNIVIKDLLLMSFQLSSSPYLFIAALIAIFIAKDINQGTIRNKLIAGASKWQIYLSSTLYAFIITLILLVLYNGIIVSFLWKIPFSNDEVTSVYLSNFFINFFLNFFLVFIASSLTVFIASMVKNMSGALVLVLVSLIFLPLMSMIVQQLALVSIIKNYGDDFVIAQEKMEQLQEIFDYFFIFQASRNSASLLNIGAGEVDFSIKEGHIYLVKVLTTGVARLGALIFGGAYLFSKSDLR